jgi:hypothetical protein
MVTKYKQIPDEAAEFGAFHMSLVLLTYVLRRWTQRVRARVSQNSNFNFVLYPAREFLLE